MNLSPNSNQSITDKALMENQEIEFSQKAPKKPDSQGNITPNDPDLQQVISAWETLPEHIRQAVMALVRTAK